MIIEQYILGQQEPFTFHSVLNAMIDDGLAPDPIMLQNKFDWLHAHWHIVVIGCTPFDEDIFQVVVR